VIAGVESYLQWFDGVNRRAVRDIGALPTAAESWAPPALEGERGWDIGELVRHMAAARIFSVRAYLMQGWKAEPWPGQAASVAEWVAALEASGAEVRRLLAGTPDEWLARTVPGQDASRSIHGWRILINMAEHDIHHRSQIDTYAGLNGWEVKQIFGIRAEDAGLSPRPNP
jgi:uncharacterized damage-inducible protein DinB